MKLARRRTISLVTFIGVLGCTIVACTVNSSDDGPGNADDAVTSGTGLRGEYFDDRNFTSLKRTRVDPVVDFGWGNGAPDPSMGVDTFSVRWTGRVRPRYSETYRFYTTSDDGVRLWVNGRARSRKRAATMRSIARASGRWLTLSDC